MDLYKNEEENSESSESSASAQAPDSESSASSQLPNDTLASKPADIVEPKLELADQSVASPELQPVVSATPEAGLSEEEKAEYGVKKMPTKIEVEDLEKKSEFLRDPLDDEIPDDLEYSSVFESKTIVNYTLAIAGFGLLVLGVFSFLNAQNINIKSSLNVISQTGQGSLSIQPPGLPAIDLKGAVNGTGADSGTGAGADSGTSTIVADSGGAGTDSGTDTGAGAGDSGTDTGTGTGSGTGTGTGTGTGSGTGTGTGDSGADTGTGADSGSTGSGAFGVFGAIDPSIFGGTSSGSTTNSNPNSGFGSFTSNPGGSDLDALLTDNDFQLDLIADDSVVAQNSFLSNTNTSVIRAGNIAGDSGPEVYLVLFMSLLFAGYLTVKTT